MHDIRKLGLQVFAAPDGMTGEAQVRVRAREIDFVTSFGKNLQALLDVMGITRMIRKENGSALKTKTVKGELKSGDVGEGEEIPMSQYKVEETVFDTIKIEKYRKGVSLEAIAEKGYEAAVQDTDEEFKSDLQNVVTSKFYTQLKAGSLTGHETAWQMAVAMAIGRVVAKFQDMKRTATGVAVWVNTLDVYKYLGAADITLQTAFGFKYMTDFLGADVVFVTSEIPQNVVVATPLNNLAAYYVDPGDSEFARAGLAFTTDAETGFIGFHTEGTYGRMISDNFAIMGLRLFCEYLDAIAYISVGSSDTQTLGTLDVTSEVGSGAGLTKLSVKEQLMSPRNSWKYKDAASATNVTCGMDVKNWTKWDGESEIASTASHHITLVECDQNYKSWSFSCRCHAWNGCCNRRAAGRRERSCTDFNCRGSRIHSLWCSSCSGRCRDVIAYNSSNESGICRTGGNWCDGRHGSSGCLACSRSSGSGAGTYRWSSWFYCLWSSDCSGSNRCIDSRSST